MDTAVLLYAPELDPVTATWRASGDAAALPHLVLVHPFDAVVDVGVVEELRFFFAGVDGFAVRFERVERSTAVLSLVPAEQQEVADLAAALALRWPHARADPAPRLAVARGGEAHLDEVEEWLLDRLPLTAELVCAGLWVREDGRWAERAELPMAAPEVP